MRDLKAVVILFDGCDQTALGVDIRVVQPEIKPDRASQDVPFQIEDELSLFIARVQDRANLFKREGHDFRKGFALQIPGKAGPSVDLPSAGDLGVFKLKEQFVPVEIDNKAGGAVGAGHGLTSRVGLLNAAIS